MRYDVTLSDGRHVKAKPCNVEFVAKFETSKIFGDKQQMDAIRTCNSLKDRLRVLEKFEYPVPNVLPASSLAEYSKKFAKAIVIGRSNAANPKGCQYLAKEIVSTLNVPQGSRIIFASV